MADAAATLACRYEDAHLLVLDKPAGLLCVPGRGPDKQAALSTRAQARWPDALVVHRLDQATSGLLLMARSRTVQRALGHQFERQQVDKRYHAWVHGLLVAPQAQDGWGVIDAPIAPDWPNRPRQQVSHAMGKPSRTRWRVLEQDAVQQRTLLELQPLTGRTHQLRVHLAHVGHPILGDALYADAAVAARAPRLLLHACALSLAHPVTGAAVAWLSPADFGAA